MRLWIACLLPCCALSVAVGQEPEPAPPTVAAPAPVAPVVAIAPPLLLPTPPPRVFGLPMEGIAPARRLAIVEAGVDFLPAYDPRVAAVAQRLERLTAVYVEDAPRIVDLTESTCMALRGAKVPASLLEMLDNALEATRTPTTTLGDFPRLYERFATSYRLIRLAPPKAP